MAEETTQTLTKPLKGEHQDDLAEGEEETVEESIRIHEQKKDANTKR